MKKISLFLLMTVVMAGCRHNSNEIVVDGYNTCDNPGIVIVDDTNVTSDVTIIETNGDRDVTLETSDNIITMVGKPGTKYKYHIWTGNKDTTTNDPDVIIDRGAVMVRKPE